MSKAERSLKQALKWVLKYKRTQPLGHLLCAASYRFCVDEKDLLTAYRRHAGGFK